SKVLAKVGSISFVATLSLLSILLKIEVSMSSSAATFLSGSPSCSRLFRKYSPKEFILSYLFGLIRQKYNLFFNSVVRALGTFKLFWFFSLGYACRQKTKCA